MSLAEPLARGVDFVSLPSTDLARSMEFYSSVLGLERSSRWQRQWHDPIGAEHETPYAPRGDGEAVGRSRRRIT